VLADAPVATVFALTSLSPVLADVAAAAIFTLLPPSLVLADTAAAAVFTRASLSLVRTDATAAAVCTCAPLSLVRTNPATTAFFTRAPPPLMFADTAAATVFALALLSLVLAQLSPAAELLACRRIQLRSRDLARAGCCAISSPQPVCGGVPPFVCCVLIRRFLYPRPVRTRAPAAQPQPACRNLKRADSGRRAAPECHSRHGQRHDGQGHRPMRVAEGTHLDTLPTTTTAANSRWDQAVQHRRCRHYVPLQPLSRCHPQMRARPK